MMTPTERDAALAAFRADNQPSAYYVARGIKMCEGHILTCDSCGAEGAYGCGEDICESCGVCGALDSTEG